MRDEELKKAMLEVDVALMGLKKAIDKKNTLHISEDEKSVYMMLNKKFSDIISTINYVWSHQNELSNKSKQDTI